MCSSDLAVVMSLLQSTIIPYLEIGGAKPDLLLVYTVILTIVLGLDHGLTVAFVGGLTIDAIAARPLGSTAFVLLLCVGVASLLGRLLARGRSASIVVAQCDSSSHGPEGGVPEEDVVVATGRSCGAKRPER